MHVHTCRKFPWTISPVYTIHYLCAKKKKKAQKILMSILLMSNHDCVHRNSEIVTSLKHTAAGGQFLSQNHKTAQRPQCCNCPVSLHTEGSVIHQGCEHMWEWVVAGVSVCLHQSVKKDTKTPELPKSPRPRLCAFCSISYKHDSTISSHSICT